MKLSNELKKIENLTTDTLLKIECVDKTLIVGYFRGYTSASDNEPEVPQIDVWSESNQTLYGLLENEIYSINVSTI